VCVNNLPKVATQWMYVSEINWEDRLIERVVLGAVETVATQDDGSTTELLVSSEGLVAVNVNGAVAAEQRQDGEARGDDDDNTSSDQRQTTSNSTPTNDASATTAAGAVVTEATKPNFSVIIPPPSSEQFLQQIILLGVVMIYFYLCDYRKASIRYCLYTASQKNAPTLKRYSSEL